MNGNFTQNKRTNYDFHGTTSDMCSQHTERCLLVNGTVFHSSKDRHVKSMYSTTLQETAKYNWCFLAKKTHNNQISETAHIHG